ncbi:MAG: TRAP transporter TatT component family protein [Gammaproteobacteria bacterium]
MSSASGNLAKNLGTSIQNHNDPYTVATALPAYLLMIDSFIESDPENIQMLQSGAKLYAAYASTFVNELWRKTICCLCQYLC